MFGLFKNLFKKSEPEAPPVAPPAPPAPPTKPVQPVAAPRPQPPAAAPPSRPAPASPPAPQAPASAPGRSAFPPGEGISIPLAAVVAKFPDTLKGLVAKQPGGSVSFQVPLSVVLPQLAAGAVRVSYSQLQAAAPTGFLTAGGELDSTPVEIPLSEIVAKLKPDQLPRRQGQRVVEVPDDIKPLFGARGQSAAGSPSAQVVQKAPLPAPAAPPVPAPAPGPEPARSPMAATPPPSTLEPPSQPIKPAMGLPDPASLRPAQAMPTRPVGTAPTSTPSLPKPAALPTVKPSPLPTAAAAAPASLPKPVAASTVAAAPAASPAPASSLEGTLTVTLGQISSSWPEGPKQAATAVAESAVEVPLKAIEEGLRKGRVLVKSSVLKSWVQGASLEIADDLDLDLPLPLLAPMFLARRGSGRQQRRVVVGDNIPDVFSGKNIPQPTQEAPAAAPSAPPAGPAPVAAPVAAPTRPAEPAAPSLASIFQQPGKSSWSPPELVPKICSLKGVFGAVVATNDGLLVAGQVPAPLKAEMMAGFVPEMFNRINQYSKEIKIGEVQTLAFSTGTMTCRMFHSDKVHLAILCQPDANLPQTTLDLILKELGRQPGK